MITEESTARHEAGHAVMYWMLTGHIPSIVVAGGDGHCDGSAMELTEAQDLHYTLAGFAAEGNYIYIDFDPANSEASDIDHARDLIRIKLKRRSSNCGDDRNTEPTFEEINNELYDCFGITCRKLIKKKGAIERIVGEFRRQRDKDPTNSPISISEEILSGLL
ncbi:hypothetical protein [Rosistilla oblonga]|uniref:hypothetical protein n=1 Tax=Rosistilla oblonga TaxID=2527990 RepID=UPI003A9799BD